MKVFSGIQPTNQLHIGNYLGAVKQWVELQNEAECLFCIVDWHAITVPYEVESLQKKIREVATIYLAAGIDPTKSIIFVQSQVKEHAELAWLLNTITALGDLQRMTQFKEKSAKYSKNVSSGLFNYPVLMASDILLYDTDVVPVGEDQKQHVELTREIARRFNSRFGEILKVPKAQIPKIGSRIMSLTDPEKKMSKSDKDASRISLFDSPEEIKKKIASSTTDSDKEIKMDYKNKAGVSNLLTIYSLFSGKEIKEIEKDYKGKGYADFKADLADLLIEKLAVFREKKAEFEQNPQLLDQILADGANRARERAQEVIKRVRTSMGLT